MRTIPVAAGLFTAFTRFIDDDLNTHSYAAYGNASYRDRPSAFGFRPVFATRTRIKDYDRSTTTSINYGAPTPALRVHDRRATGATCRRWRRSTIR